MKTLTRHWFLTTLAILLAVGFVYGQSLHTLTEVRAIRYVIVFFVMLAMALPLQLSAFLEAMKRPAATLLAIVINLGVLPLLSAACLFLFQPSVAAGFVVLGATPCTLAGASVWTRKAGGNDAVAFMVTVLTNFFCFLLTPGLIWLILGTITQIDPLVLLGPLLGLIVLPILLAQAARRLAFISEFSVNFKHQLAVFAQVGILLMVLIGAAKTTQRIQSGNDELNFLLLPAMIVVSLVLHVAALWGGYRLAKLFRMERANAIAVAIAGSQKTLMVGLLVCAELGVTILPMVIYHTCQMIIDTIFADRMASRAVKPS